MRAFGPDLAEVPLLATRHELQGNGLGPLLLHSIETALLKAGVRHVIMPALPLSEGLSPDAHVATELRAAAAAGPKPWGTLVGYRMALSAQLLDACRVPMLQLPGTCYLIKELSHESLTQVTAWHAHHTMLKIKYESIQCQISCLICSQRWHAATSRPRPVRFTIQSALLFSPVS